MAGKLGTMAATGEKQGNTTDKKQKPSGRSKTNAGRKARGSNNPAKEKLAKGNPAKGKPAKEYVARPGSGAACLRSSINTLVEKESKELAKALVDHAKAGNVSSAKLLVELTGAKDPPPAPEQKQCGTKLSGRWGTEPQWQGTAEEDEGSGCGGREPEL